MTWTPCDNRLISQLTPACPGYVGMGARLPVVEYGEAEGLPLRVVAQVGLEAERLQHRQERLDQEDGRPRLGHIRRHVPAPLAQHGVDRALMQSTATKGVSEGQN